MIAEDSLEQHAIPSFQDTGRACAKKSNLKQSRTLVTLRDTLLPKLLSGDLLFPEPNRSP